jgi:hypothetical protein
MSSKFGTAGSDEKCARHGFPEEISTTPLCKCTVSSFVGTLLKGSNNQV